jgi:hemoglobin-like flavoprotein
VRAVHHRAARDLLAATFDDVLGDRFGPAEREAWLRAWSLISELMLSA